MQRNLAEGGAAVPGVANTAVMTKYDELVVPWTSGYLEGETNVVLQDPCPLNLSEHAAMAFDPVAAQIMRARSPAEAGGSQAEVGRRTDRSWLLLLA